MSEPRIVIVTGCTSGIGKELCALYRENGDTVVGMARTADEATGDMSVDVTDTDAVKRAVACVAQKYGHIDVVVSNAGGGLSGATELLPVNEIEKQIALNFTGALAVVQASLGYMSAGGKAIFISSACALFALPYRSIYCASKAAVNMAAYGLYMELKNSGISVTTICPGDIKSGFTANRVKISDGGERYGDAPVLAAQKIDSREDKRMDLKKASIKIFKCAQKCKKPLYIIGFKYKVLNFFRHILPEKLMLDITNKMFG